MLTAFQQRSDRLTTLSYYHRADHRRLLLILNRGTEEENGFLRSARYGELLSQMSCHGFPVILAVGQVQSEECGITVPIRADDTVSVAIKHVKQIVVQSLTSTRQP